MATFNYNILQLNSIRRKIILFTLDNFICLASFFLAFYLRLDLFLINEIQNQIISFLLVYATFIILCLTFSFYRPLSRYYDLLNIAKIILVFFFYAFMMLLLFSYLKLPGIPRSLGILHPIIFFIFFISSRIFANFIITKLNNKGKLSNIIICCNINSAEFLRNILKNYNILFFITDDENFQKRLIANIPIYTLSNLKKTMFKDKNIDYLFIDPNLNVEGVKKKIRSKINQKKSLSIKIIPKLQNFLDFQLREDIKNIKIFNKKIEYSSARLKDKFKKTTILITGAGGSIGSELVKEILRLQPKEIILIENSEYNLYKVLEQLENLKFQTKLKTKIEFFLVSVTQSKKIKNICIKYKPDYVFHCAAFKHVPLVEKNILEAVENNFISTINLCKIAMEIKLSKLILISSDKAVKPSSIMGSTKRLSELAIKYFSLKSKIQKKSTSFSAVRFANVLNSSGSVVPLFARQIKAGGPITITHKKVERYFMTIIDAVRLVLETTLISKNGEIMLLKMGKQIKIMDLAKKIANFYNLNIKDEKNPFGEIDIVEIGLRPGEKIREELFYDHKTKKTTNKDILSVDNLKLNINKFEKLCQNINICLKNNNSKKLKGILLDQNNMF